MSLQARFHLRRGAFTLDVNLQLPSSGISAIFGPSGSGKTTLLRTIAGLEKAAGGRCQVGPEIWQQDGLFLPTHRRAVGYVFQDARLFPHLSVDGNLRFGYQRLAPEERRIALDQVIDLLDLAPLLSRRTEDLSGGEQQRVAIGRAVAASPQLLLMDEPLASLDAARKRELLPYFSSLAREFSMPILYVSHEQEEVLRLAQYLVLLQEGKVVAEGPTAELMTRLDLDLAQEPTAQCVLEATVQAHDPAYGLAVMAFAGGELTVGDPGLAVGEKARLLIRATDVSLTLQPAQDTSILNILPATVEAVVDSGKAQATVRLQVGGSALLAKITRKSAAHLQLHPGQALFAQIKSVAVLA